jgi:hypothetical protein
VVEPFGWFNFSRSCCNIAMELYSSIQVIR